MDRLFRKSGLFRDKWDVPHGGETYGETALRRACEKTLDTYKHKNRKYTRAKKLTPTMLYELIEKIEVHQAEKIDGKKVQQLTIHYNCNGSIEIPNIEKLPENNAQIHTRQGVDIKYMAHAV